MTDHPAESPATTSSRPLVRLFGVSALVLFLELACIRYFAATVAYLTFFTNIILLASVLGMSVGCLATQGRNHLRWTPAVLLPAVAFAAWTLHAYHDQSLFAVSIGSGRSPEQVYFGADNRPANLTAGAIPVEVLAAIVFALVAAAFVGPGQAMGRAFDTVPDRLRAYTANVAGSLAGILVFALMSQVRLGPPAWFLVALVGILAALETGWRERAVQAVLAAATLGLVFQSSESYRAGIEVFWSPYYKVEYHPAARIIDTNNIGHQQMVDVSTTGLAYGLPHALARDAGAAPFEDVLIIGAGSGNDVSAALGHGAKRVDAVEIDPVILDLGRKHHPNRPYDDPRVRPILDDGRNVLRRLNSRYDFVLYALVDSLVLRADSSSVRLESFLFTHQALTDVRARLKPDGVFCMMNYFRRGWMIGRLTATARAVFGVEPIVLSLPYRSSIGNEDQQGAFTVMLVGPPGSSRLEAIRQAFADGKTYWSSPGSLVAASPQPAYGPRPPGVGEDDPIPQAWQHVGPAKVETSSSEARRIPTDDWPFLYLRDRAIPGLNLKGMALVATVSLAFLLTFVRWRTPEGRIAWPDGQMVFLGAGFMLLETKGVVQLALVFGTTWAVNTIVIAAVLAMILLGNLYVLRMRPTRPAPYYALLFVALTVQGLVPVGSVLGLPGPLRALAACALVFVPVAFAAVVFALAFRRSRHPSADLGANIVGVILGGLSESASLVLGFQGLLVLATAYYALAAAIAAARRT